MTDNKIKQGDICIYHYADGNGSVNIVEVVKVIDSDKSKIKCIQVIYDNSGNGWFEYMLQQGDVMTASNIYLHKIEQVDAITDQLNSAINGQETLQKYIAKKDAFIQEGIDLAKQIPEMIATAKAEAYKECTEKLKSIFGEWIYDHKTDNFFEEMVGDSNES